MLLNFVIELAAEGGENYDFFPFLLSRFCSSCFHNYTEPTVRRPPAKMQGGVSESSGSEVRVRRLMTHSFNGLVRSFEGSFTHMLRQQQ